MKNTLLKIIFLGIILMLLGACTRTETSRVYYNPAWTYDGKIISVKESRFGFSFAGLGGGSSGYDSECFLVTMDTEGENEAVIKELGESKFPQINCSPQGTYYALKYDYKIEIYQFSDGELVSTLSFDDKIQEYDWSTNDTKLIIRDESSTAIYNTSGEKQTDINVWAFAWKYNNNIFGQQGSYPDIIMVYLDENANLVSSNIQANTIDQYFPDGQSYLGDFKKISVPSFNIIEDYATLSDAIAEGESYDGAHALVNQPINPVNPNQIMFTGPTGSTFSTDATGEGIYLINIDGTNRERIK
ncbi:hypothetical protein ACFL2K_03565 [Candidatus Margulisiibacteriota bacterium]